jgi:hypothetical protein
LGGGKSEKWTGFASSEYGDRIPRLFQVAKVPLVTALPKPMRSPWRKS